MSNPDIIPQLAMWTISGRDKESANFRRMLQKSSWHQYDSLFGKWVSLCNQWNADPVSGTIGDIVNFRASLFTEDYQYRSLNSYHSPISSVHEKVDGYEVGQHPMISRLLKGAIHQQSPKPRFSAHGMSKWLPHIWITYVIMPSSPYQNS